MREAPMTMVESLPPRSRTGRVDWEQVAIRLKANPGEWGELYDMPRSTASQIRAGKVAALRPPEEFEAAIRKADGAAPGRCTLYVRWIGAQ